jgi:DNA-binding transcriptional regulator GbsR (MarR family)
MIPAAEQTKEPPRNRNQTELAEYVERFASALMTIGFPRMPARVFSVLLATDSGRLTAADLAESLRASPAAISGAVRYLAQLGIVTREREPGSRRDLFRVHEAVWQEAALRREHMLRLMHSTVSEGIEVLGRHTPAGARLAETLAYFEFVQEELPHVLERWRARRAQQRPSTDSAHHT